MLYNKVDYSTATGLLCITHYLKVYFYMAEFYSSKIIPQTYRGKGGPRRTRACTHTRSTFQVLRPQAQKLKKARLIDAPFRRCYSFLGEAPGPLPTQAASRQNLQTMLQGWSLRKLRPPDVPIGRPIVHGLTTKQRRDSAIKRYPFSPCRGGPR